MKSTTLEEFLASPVRNMWISHGTFKLYVRRSSRCIDKELKMCFDIANIESPVETRGKGEFWALIDCLNMRLQREDIAESLEYLYVESVVNHDLIRSLIKRGFTIDNNLRWGAGAPSLYKKIEDHV